jgi:hypothetical protein
MPDSLLVAGAHDSSITTVFELRAVHDPGELCTWERA